MNYHNITKDDMLNGKGLRVVLWVAGCSHKCKGCQNPITHNPKGGIPFTEETKKELYTELEKEHIQGITFSGGDPLNINNRETITKLAKEIKEKYNKDIWLYTGYTYEEVQELEIMKYIDVLVDGKFIEKLKDKKLHWRGSSNQRLIDVQRTIKEGVVCLIPVYGKEK